MVRVLHILVALLLVQGTAQAGSTDFSLRLARGTTAEKAAAVQLRRLIDQYDVSRLSFTYSIMINEYDAPHSFPVLTLNAVYLKDDASALSTFLHEQLHWYGLVNQTAVDAAITDLKALYPTVPVGNGEGASDEYSTYVHLIVGLQEYDATASYLGRTEAKRVIMGKRHYKWIYNAVIENADAIRAILHKHGLDDPST